MSEAAGVVNASSELVLSSTYPPQEEVLLSAAAMRAISSETDVSTILSGAFDGSSRHDKVSDFLPGRFDLRVSFFGLNSFPISSSI